MNRIFNSFVYRLHRFFARLSAPVMVYGYKRFDGLFLKNTRISTSTIIVSPENLMIEDHVFIGHYNFIEASGSLTIQEGVQISNFVSISTHSMHNAIRLYGKDFRTVKEKSILEKGSISIGAYSFIGPHSVISPKTKIGKGSIVSAYSHVNGVFPDFSVIAGNPAKVVGSTQKVDEAFLSWNPLYRSTYFNQEFLEHDKPV
ncbi:MAG: acyltransferase [Bacteroidetes bacterium]|nr:acyltransferase [Bacteroidota bacterium]